MAEPAAFKTRFLLPLTPLLRGLTQVLLSLSLSAFVAFQLLR